MTHLDQECCALGLAAGVLSRDVARHVEKDEKNLAFTFNFSPFAASACAPPFVVLYYQELRFTATHIGLLTGVTILITLFGAPLWTGLADAPQAARASPTLRPRSGQPPLHRYCTAREPGVYSLPAQREG